MSFESALIPTVTNGAYSGGDIMGGLLLFEDVAREVDEPFFLHQINIALKAAVTPAFTLHFFGADPSATTKDDNAAYSLNAADVFKHVD
ncbi:MAG: hypothetical protein AB7F74_23565, partial [Parvibaculaceae bacterium]